MISRTHDLAAFTALNLVVVNYPLPDFSFSTALVVMGVCFLGGLTPDLDKPTSGFWQKFPAGTVLSKVFHPFLGGHRLISHSLLGLALFGWGVGYLLSLASPTLLVNMELVWWAFMIGFASHLIMDSLTTEAVPWLFPIPLHFGFPPFKILRLKTGGMVEKAFLFPALLVANGYLFYHFYPLYLHLCQNFLK